MSSVAIRLPKILITEAQCAAKLNFRSIPMQIEYWAMLGRCAEQNPDLPMSFIKTCLASKEEISQAEPFTF